MGECKTLLAQRLQNHPTQYHLSDDRPDSRNDSEYRIHVAYDSFIRALSGQPLRVEFLVVTFTSDRANVKPWNVATGTTRPVEILYADPRLFELVVETVYRLLPEKYKNAED